MQPRVTATALTILLGVAASAGADTISYYVGLDGRSTPFTAPAGIGGGDYPDQPNDGRLTLLFHHGDHFHALGTYTYSGPSASPVLADTNANNRTPEVGTLLPPVQLQKGSGAFAGTWRSGLPSAWPQNLEYGNYEMRNVHSLAGVDDVTYHSSAGRWDDPFDGAQVQLELVSATFGLNIAFGNTPTADLTAGNRWTLGQGDELFSATPTFWVAPGAPGGTYTAEFRLVDGTGRFGDSGRFFVDVAKVPEPAAAGLVLLGLMAVALGRRLTARA
ncbi:MAG: all3515 family Zur-repressed PEP-CTERM protein [Vicinamibacterales bacterium]